MIGTVSPRKSWITDPQDISWETFLTLGESTIYGGKHQLSEVRPKLPLRVVAVRPQRLDMTDPICNVLFLCTGNSARSIMGEAILNRIGAGRFKAYSAGSHRNGEVDLRTLQLLKRLNYSTEGYRSKSWDEFARPDAPHLDFVFTVCDQAAQEVCPIWPAQPMTAHWGLPDPAMATGTDAEMSRAFYEAYSQLNNRISLFGALPLAPLDKLALKKRLDDIGIA